MKFAFLVIVVLSLFTATGVVNSSQGVIEAPDAFESVKTWLLKALEPFQQGFEQAFEQAKIVWNRLYLWARGWWLNSSWPDRFKSLFLQREAIFKQEFDKEKEEMKEDVKKEIPELQKTFWEKFKEIVK